MAVFFLFCGKLKLKHWLQQEKWGHFVGQGSTRLPPTRFGYIIGLESAFRGSRAGSEPRSLQYVGLVLWEAKAEASATTKMWERFESRAVQDCPLLALATTRKRGVRFIDCF